MPPEDLSSLLVFVEPAGAVAPIAFKYPENAKYHRYGRARAALTDDDDDDSRGSDQSANTPNSKVLNVSAKAYLALSFDPGPKDLSKGFVFGSDPQTCDVLLAKDKTSGVSGNHFSINVDWDTGNPIVTCLTLDEKNGIRIFSELDCVWKLYLTAACEVIEPGTATHLEITHRMKLVIHNPHRDSKNYRYNKNLQKYLKRCKSAVPNMNHMKLYDPEQTPLMISRTRGLTGREYVTTTSTVRDKIVLCEARGHQNWAGDSKIFIVKRFRNTSDRWKKHAKNKLSMLRALQQRHIIIPEDIITDGTEYMPVYLPEPQETLADRLASRGPLPEGLAGLVLVQVFEGLKFLHENDMVHGGLYPGSIRFEHSSRPNVRISDIGLYPYVELDNQEERQLYATQRLATSNPLPVWDTWSAGVVGLLLLSPDGLPTRKRSHTQRQWTITVANRAVDFRNTHPTVKNKASRFITSVLKVEYDERLSAEECLQDPWLREIKEEGSDESTETEETTEAEEVSGEDTETEEPRSSQSKGKQPLYARRASSGNQHRQLSRTPISKGKQQQQQAQHSRRTSIGTSGHQLRQRSMTPQSIPPSPSTLIGSRHTTMERSITPQNIPPSSSTPLGSRHTTLERSIEPEHDNDMRGFKGSRPSK